ncbi:hypothetical protein HK096_007988 [Nowakowskiella sp. JEL0078]|nr:hypothetical protein HK096_007988 [Nowakowskiella sp. JEL0078]
MASRSSIELFTHMFFRNKIEQLDGYVIRILKNGFSVLVPQYGIEGFVYASATPDSPSPFLFDPATNRLRAVGSSNVVVRLFDRVVVQVSIEEAGISGQRSKLVLRLVEPFVDGFSVESIDNGREAKKIRK